MKTDVASLNIRHLRAFSEACRTGSISNAADDIHLSQPALTYAISKLEDQLRSKILVRGPKGVTPTRIGETFRFRVDRALAHLNSKLPRPEQRGAPAVPRPIETRVTSQQLRVLIAIAENGSYTSAAEAMGIAQPTVYRAAKDLEAASDLTVFAKAGSRIQLTQLGSHLSRNALLMFAELNQGLQEIDTANGRRAARIRIGALPLARATILPRAIDLLASRHVQLHFYCDDGTYSDLLRALRNGTLDVLVGALRDPAPSKDITQELLFADRLGIFCGPDHPLLRVAQPSIEDALAYPWVAPRRGTPTRDYFDLAIWNTGEIEVEPQIETSSLILVRELLQSRNRLTLISRAQVASDALTGKLVELPIPLEDPPRPIGLTFRESWYPTQEQNEFLVAIRSVSKGFDKFRSDQAE